MSKKRYYCKYCEIYIADDVPSKQQHEGGLRHKGNKERFVRGLYKASEKKKHDLEEETREMARVERVRPLHQSLSQRDLTSVPVHRRRRRRSPRMSVPDMLRPGPAPPRR